MMIQMHGVIYSQARSPTLPNYALHASVSKISCCQCQLWASSSANY